MPMSIRSARLQLAPFQMTDAEDVFGCISLDMTRFLPWSPPSSLSEYKTQRQARLQADDGTDLSLVIRRGDTGECLGLAALHGIAHVTPELGIWLKVSAHGQGYAGEAVAAVAQWANTHFGTTRFLYPVATQNIDSRRLAEKLGGRVIGTRSNPKYPSVVYLIPAPASEPR